MDSLVSVEVSVPADKVRHQGRERPADCASRQSGERHRVGFRHLLKRSREMRVWDHTVGGAVTIDDDINLPGRGGSFSGSVRPGHGLGIRGSIGKVGNLNLASEPIDGIRQLIQNHCDVP